MTKKGANNPTIIKTPDQSDHPSHQKNQKHIFLVETEYKTTPTRKELARSRVEFNHTLHLEQTAEKFSQDALNQSLFGRGEETGTQSQKFNTLCPVSPLKSNPMRKALQPNLSLYDLKSRGRAANQDTTKTQPPQTPLKSRSSFKTGGGRYEESSAMRTPGDENSFNMISASNHGYPVDRRRGLTGGYRTEGFLEDKENNKSERNPRDTKGYKKIKNKKQSSGKKRKSKKRSSSKSKRRRSSSRKKRRRSSHKKKTSRNVRSRSGRSGGKGGHIYNLKHELEKLKRDKQQKEVEMENTKREMMSIKTSLARNQQFLMELKGEMLEAKNRSFAGVLSMNDLL